MSLSLIDTHAHLNDDAFANDLPKVLERAAEVGVRRIIVPGYDLDSSRAAVAMAAGQERVLAAVGIHPHDAKSYASDSADTLAALSGEAEVVAIGEIGLDFHYDFSPRAAQTEAFRAQLELAAELGLPVIVHSREAEDETLQVVREHAAKIPGCVFHCFSGDEHFAEQVLALGFYIGVDGPITYRSAGRLRRVVALCPIERLLIETDSPYLTPAPHRGKRNEPACVRYVADAVAGVKEMSPDDVAAITTQNARTLFGPNV